MRLSKHLLDSIRNFDQGNNVPLSHDCREGCSIGFGCDAAFTPEEALKINLLYQQIGGQSFLARVVSDPESDLYGRIFLLQ